MQTGHFLKISGRRPSPRGKHFGLPGPRGCLSPKGEFPKCTEDDRACRMSGNGNDDSIELTPLNQAGVVSKALMNPTHKCNA
jgi:hypothetical protein